MQRNKWSNVLLDLVRAELRCSEADPKPSIRSIGASIHVIWTNGSSPTLGSLPGPMMIQLVLFSSGREDECFTVNRETNISLVVRSVRLCSALQARRAEHSRRWTQSPLSTVVVESDVVESDWAPFAVVRAKAAARLTWASHAANYFGWRIVSGSRAKTGLVHVRCSANAWKIRLAFHFCFEKERRYDEEENEIRRDRERRLQATPPDHLQPVSWWCIRLTRLTLVFEMIRYHLVQLRQNFKTKCG